MEEIIYIYVLIDPNTNEPRYVGKTNNIKRRFRKHIHFSRKDTKTHVRAWIKSLLKTNQKPLLEIIEKTDKNHWEEREKFWIRNYRMKHNLTNITDGGEGVSGREPWNKGKRGVMKVNEGSIKPGEHRSIPTEIKKGERISPKTEFKKGKIPYNRICVDKFDLNGHFICRYSSLTEGAKSINVTYNAINKCINKGTNKCKGFIWKKVKN